MNSTAKLGIKSKAKSYFSLMKPGIILGNLVNYTTGYLLASNNSINLSLYFTTLIGLALIIASGCVLNNYIDRKSDEKMTRTQNRALVKKIISLKSALIFSIVLFLLGAIFLIQTNLLTLFSSLFGFVIYVLLYTFLKYYSYHATIVGSIAGAIPALVGYCTVNNSIDLKGAILFGIIVIWQMPHFYAISIYRLNDFKKASIPVLPLKKGIYETKVQMMFYIIAFIITLSMLTILGYANYVFLVSIGALGIYWLLLSIKGFNCKNDNIWARKMFRFSLLVILGIFTAILIQ